MVQYTSKKWKAKRKAILLRAGYKDEYDARFGKSTEADTVHHIFPAERYPEYAFCDWNLIALSNKNHNRCHVRGSHELTDFGNSLKKIALKKRPAPIR